MRCIDFSGENEFNGATLAMCARIKARDSVWKIFGSSRRVIKRVLDGGLGCWSGGMLERSIDNGERERLCEMEEGEAVDGEADCGGDDEVRFCVCSGDGILVCVCSVGSAMAYRMGDVEGEAKGIRSC